MQSVFIAMARIQQERHYHRIRCSREDRKWLCELSHLSAIFLLRSILVDPYVMYSVKSNIFIVVPLVQRVKRRYLIISNGTFPHPLLMDLPDQWEPPLRPTGTPYSVGDFFLLT